MTKDINEEQVGSQIGSLQFRVTRESIKDYLASLDSSEPWYLNDSPFGEPIVPACYLCDDYLRLFFHGNYNERGLHAKAEYEFKGPIRYGELLTTRGVVVDKYVKRDRKYVVMEVITTDESGREVLRGKNTFIMEGK